MSDCCTPDAGGQQAPKRHSCPKNGENYLLVPFQTVLQHVKQPWSMGLKEQGFYFCDDPGCDVVYFGFDNTEIKKNSLRSKVGVKEVSDDTALLCYCFGVSRAEAYSNKEVKKFVIEQTKTGLCSCATRNPSGRCCLKDFPK